MNAPPTILEPPYIPPAQMLPSDILVHIFQHLTTTHLGRMLVENLLLVCRSWYHTAAHNSSIWSIIDFHPCMADEPSHAAWWRRRIKRRLIRSGQRLLDVNIDTRSQCHNAKACYCSRKLHTSSPAISRTADVYGPEDILDIILTIKLYSKRFRSLLISIPRNSCQSVRLIANAALAFLLEAPALDTLIIYDAIGCVKAKEAFHRVSLPVLRYCEFRALSGLAGLAAVYRITDLWLKIDSPWPGNLPQWRTYRDGPCGLLLHRFFRLRRLVLEFPCQGQAKEVNWFGCELPHLKELTLRGPEALRANLSALKTPSLVLLRITLHKRPRRSSWGQLRYLYTDSWWEQCVRGAAFASLGPLQNTPIIWLDIHRGTYDEPWFKKYAPEILRPVAHSCQLRLSRHWEAIIGELLRTNPLFLPGLSHLLIERNGRIDERRVERPAC